MAEQLLFITVAGLLYGTHYLAYYKGVQVQKRKDTVTVRANNMTLTLGVDDVINMIDKKHFVVVPKCTRKQQTKHG